MFFFMLLVLVNYNNPGHDVYFSSTCHLLDSNARFTTQGLGYM